MKLARGCLAPLVALFVPVAILFSVYFLILQDPSYAHMLFLLIIPVLIVAMGVRFFRDPDVPLGQGIISPADGVISRIVQDGDKLKIDIFMNVHNIHVNRAPVSGVVESLQHTPGAHRPAYNKDSDRNERVTMNIVGEESAVQVVQIAGSLARRIVPYVKVGDILDKGDKIGLIRFGSRVDIILEKARPSVNVGDRIVVGETIASFERHGGNT